MELYHGSIISGIQRLKPFSQSRNSSDEKVVYLTANRGYALFYIWDSKKNKRANKWVTCSIKNGIATYYEQFPNQIKAFYNGVSGYLYSTIKNNDFIKSFEEDMWLCRNEVSINKCEKIENVYNELLRLEENGVIKIARFEKLSENEKERLTDMMVGYILKKELLLSPAGEEACFISAYYKQAWKKAKEIINS